MTKTNRKKTVLCAGLFVLIFSGLLITATFTDLQVSRALTKGVLPAGRYYADDFFGVLFECIGTCPELLLSALCAEIITLYAARLMKKGLWRTTVMTVGAVAIPGLYLWEFNDLLDYVFRHVEVPAERPAFLWGIGTFLALLCALLGTLAVNNFSDESLRKLLKFAVIALCTIVAGILLVQVIKNPVGRMRYRSMNVIDDYSGYTRWYVVNGQPDKEMMRAVFGTADAYKSFPSGHTRAAAGAFYLTVMASVIGVKHKGLKAALWIFAFAFTVTVAVSRIMVGAHFFSDVLVGGTIGFLFAMLSGVLYARLPDLPKGAIK